MPGLTGAFLNLEFLFCFLLAERMNRLLSLWISGFSRREYRCLHVHSTVT